MIGNSSTPIASSLPSTIPRSEVTGLNSAVPELIAACACIGVRGFPLVFTGQSKRFPVFVNFILAVLASSHLSLSRYSSPVSLFIIFTHCCPVLGFL